MWGWADMIIWAVTVLMIGNAICNPFGMFSFYSSGRSNKLARHFGFGRDVWRLPFSHTTAANRIFFIGGVIYVAAVAMTKMAFLLFYIRLFPTLKFGRIAYPLLALTFVQGTIFTFLFLFQCSPINYAWLQWDGEADGTCLNFDIGAAIHAIVNIILDFLIFALPVFQLRKLNMSKKRRWQVLLMFAVGFFVTLISIVRLTSLVHLGDSINLTYDYIPLAYFSDLELNIGIACFCMPAARVVIRRFFPNCGIATTGHDSVENKPTNSRINHAGPLRDRGYSLSDSAGSVLTGSEPTAKVPKKVSTRRPPQDEDSDQVELVPYGQEVSGARVWT
ncbi:uncharacterized protein HMPREF1541_00051 [Cyphellophora europaea CBS 101466]|uniref:Rhodopsin domain-containing protein n=1 Tax=Cyphellophora europaea (strain CBS 101466) TaxID=1220924 RepID=W2SB96_CYPE1|nr:uncharacterized protein HMPREF1541_00051 [Cyphellophora europaea CBS 101466]ETN45870.1 hypothetical protein HMPREF1541_00051 [Cyphellophora europaea CBS 101466]